MGKGKREQTRGGEVKGYCGEGSHLYFGQASIVGGLETIRLVKPPDHAVLNL